MCGINGFTWKDEGLIQKMNKRIKHRGSDDDGFFVDNNISLGHDRLSIIDLSEKGHQPMHHKNLSIVFNGEIYNFKEIRKELKELGYKFISNTDTEVILFAYKEWKEDCLHKFNGMFAFAIWDKDKQELFIVRDRLGIKPLYYYNKDNKFIFSSEIKGILEHNILRKVNINSLNFLLRVLYIPEPETIFENIFKLPAGHYAIIKNKNFKINKYWDIENFKDSNKNYKQLKKEILILLKDSVKKRLISDRPLGVLLSGGWDSTSVLGIMSELGIKDIQTFTSGFQESNQKYNKDLILAKKTTKYYNTKHNEIFLPKESIKDILEKAIYHLDEPNASSTVVPMYYLSKKIREKVVVVLGGDGGDELFAGYPRYWQSYYLNKFQKLPKFIKNIFPYFILEKKFNKTDLRNKLNILPGFKRFSLFKVHPKEKIKNILKKDLYKEELVENYFVSKYFNEKKYDDFEKKLLYLDIKNWLSVESLWKTDRMTMANALEERVPLLDHKLMELSFQIPTKYKIHKFAGKKIFKDVVKKYIPKHLRNIKKRGWLTPGGNWLKKELKPLMEDILSGIYCPDIKQYFDLNYCNKIYTEHLNGNSAHSNQLWTILTFAIWYNKFIK